MLRRFGWVACVILAVVRAVGMRWTSDDAFVVFRYAQNLVAGNGLVFNVGERVEGYSDLSWTLWTALGIRVGVRPELWTIGSGAVAYGGVIALLVWIHRLLASRACIEPLAIPLSALAVASQVHFAVHSVSGLETSAFAFLALAGFALLLAEHPALAGLAFGIAAVTRPEGVLFGATATAALFAMRRPRQALLCGGVTLALFGAQEVFRLEYYGDLFPNTYYAKSGGAAWWRQGGHYLMLYLLRYPPLALAPFAVVLAPKSIRPTVLLAAVLGGVHALWVVRVGGDFMFGRFLIPSTPFFFVALDAALLRWRDRPVGVVGAIAVMLALVFVPSPIGKDLIDGGVVEEHAFYTEDRGVRTNARANAVRPFLAGTKARVAFYGSEARFVYYASIPVAIESATGLTDTFVAHQTLAVRGRPGHEKSAPAAYLVDVRHVDLAFSPDARRISNLDDLIPFVPVLAGGVRGQLLHWDPAFVELLRSRGALVADYPSALDAGLSRLDAQELASMYEQAKHFYFPFTPDPERQARFEERLGKAK